MKNTNQNDNDDDDKWRLKKENDAKPIFHQHKIQQFLASSFLGMTLALSSFCTPTPAFATDTGAIVGCLFQKCTVQLAKCVANPKCLANVVCINTCNGRPDEIECQIKCGDIFENEVVGEFNKCVVSDMSCVQQKPDEGLYPVPDRSQTVSSFDTKFFNTRLYITAGMCHAMLYAFSVRFHKLTRKRCGVVLYH
jgi:violaxanthin de-epoxidase